MSGKPAFFAFDTETTGLDPAKDEILSIAMILLDEAFEECSRKVIYAFPDGEVSPEAAAINGYSAEEWATRGAVSQIVLFSEVYEYVRQYKSLIPLGHNVPFDLAFLKTLFTRHDSSEFGKFFSYHCLDTVSVSLFFDMVLFGKKGATQKLVGICERFGITLNNAHDALADVEATIAVFKYFYTQLGGVEKRAEVPPPPPTQSRMLIKRDDTWIIGGGKHKGRPLTEVALEVPDYLQWMLTKIDDLSDLQREAIHSCLT